MLIAKIEYHLWAFLRIFVFNYSIQKVGEAILNEKGAADDPNNFIGISTATYLLSDNADKAICDYGNIHLNLYGVFRVSPKCSYSEMLFYPLKNSSTTQRLLYKQAISYAVR